MNARQGDGPDSGGAADTVAVDRFASALRQAMARNRWSERHLAGELGITIGTTQKYFRGKVHPLSVQTRVSHKLAKVLGITLDALVRFYETGEFASDLSFAEVVSWVRSSAGLEHLGPMLNAMSSAGQRIGLDGEGCVHASAPKPYTWPREELREAGISDVLRQRMGLTDEALDRLERSGEFDDALVEAFAVAVNLQEDAVRQAFSQRVPVV